MKKYYAYSAFSKDTKALITKVKPFEADAIIAIARGGMTLAHAMAEGLNIRNVQSIRTELYDGASKRSDITLFGECLFSEDIRKVLVVDDIADSGETLAFIMEHLKRNFPLIVFQSCTLFYKKTSLYEPDIWINEADAWIEFFWEKDFLSKL
ncbi:Putative nucleotide phosphoribosyltransferase [hydrothermal vent metagenome]|uniref:Putative nucleotide phosphoribosyltransferase n=1 Tax=hydrothermal vent metagenome TaxID=652676 RepID=A0A1W1CYU7_9ZZZZ